MHYESLYKIAFVLIGYSVACVGAGGLILQVLKTISKNTSRSSAGTDIATAFVLGQGVLASAWLLLAVNSWFIAQLIAAIAFTVALSGNFLMRHTWLRFRRQIAEKWWELRSESWAWQLLAASVILLILLWGTSLGRTMAGDAGAFYMALSKLVAHSRALLMLPGYESFSAVGLQGEMHHAALIALHSPDAAQLFAWPTSIAAAVMLLAIGKQVGMGHRGQWITLLIVYSSSAIIYMSGSGKVDIYALALGIATYYWVLQIHKGTNRLAIWLTGLFFGFAVVAKMSYIPPLGISVLVLFIWSYLRDGNAEIPSAESIKSFFVAGLQIAGATLIAVIPHLIKNGVLFDNPFAPFGTDSQGWTNQIWYSPATTKRILLSYPLSLIYGNYWGQEGSLSALILAFAPLALFLERPSRWRNSTLLAITMSALIGVLTWVILRPSVFAPRYILATLMLFALLPARAVENLFQREERPGWLSMSVLAGAILIAISVPLTFNEIVFFPEKTYQYLAGEMGNCGRDYQYCGQLTMLNRNADFGDRIMLGTYQRYWLRSDLLQCLSTVEDEGEIFSTPIEDRWTKLYQHGFRYLLADNITHAHFKDGLDFENIPHWLEVVEMSYDGQISLFRLDVIADPQVDMELDCLRRGPSKVWEVVSP